MKINSKSKWGESEIKAFLNASIIPMRLAFMNKNDEPMIWRWCNKMSSIPAAPDFLTV